MTFLNKVLFMNTMMMGTIIAISSYSWITMWIGMEINLLSIIPIMKSSKNKFPAESTMKYFITQSMASSILLISILLSLNLKNLFNEEFSNFTMLMLNSSFLIKMGAAPFHFWFPEIIEGLSWMNIMIMLTWQKIAPMILLMYNMKNMSMFIHIIIISSSLIGGIQGLNQMSIRKILAYSSMNHIGWMISSLMCSSLTWLLYFLIYSTISINIIFLLNKFNIFYMNQMNMFNKNKMIKIFLAMNFLSLGGLPPFLGFMPKWLTMLSLIKNNFYFISSIMVFLTLITLYFYTRMIFSSLTINNNENLIHYFNKLNFYFFYLNFFSLSTLLMSELLYMIY
uniref:NADH dehydrogenase subunit 2 n=1 Tax=Lissorhoptrus oryzophilus TaxID=308863 RepID=UPI001BF04776|nr:NADH dehydrogenase subunit 2 [Lissorhoptrus oryzophilus]QUA05789.1 NADH dehydrogenase subunit 2 [Lissorhoptrus oryzophilus]